VIGFACHTTLTLVHSMTTPSSSPPRELAPFALALLCIFTACDDSAEKRDPVLGCESRVSACEKHCDGDSSSGGCASTYDALVKLGECLHEGDIADDAARRVLDGLDLNCQIAVPTAYARAGCNNAIDDCEHLCFWDPATSRCEPLAELAECVQDAVSVSADETAAAFDAAMRVLSSDFDSCDEAIANSR